MQLSCPLLFSTTKNVKFMRHPKHWIKSSNTSHFCYNPKIPLLQSSPSCHFFIFLSDCFLISTPNAQFWQNNFAGKCQIETNESMEKNYQLRIPNPKKCFTEPNLFKIRASKMTLLIQIFLIIPPNQQSLT